MRSPPRGGAITIGSRFKTDWMVKPTIRFDPESSSPTSEKVAGRPSDFQAMTRRAPAKMPPIELQAKYKTNPAVVRKPKHSSARRLPRRSDSQPPG